MMETMVAMMNKMTTGGSTGTGKAGTGNKTGPRQQQYNDKDDKQANRRYTNDNYC
jgi:hypothetical protein